MKYRVVVNGTERTGLIRTLEKAYDKVAWMIECRDFHRNEEIVIKIVDQTGKVIERFARGCNNEKMNQKDIERYVDQMDAFIIVDQQLGCGNAPSGAYDSIYAVRDEFLEVVAQMHGFASYMEMIMHEAELFEDELPF